MLYAFTSATANNGSAFAGLSANTPGYNLALGIAMWVGRFLMIIPILALAGSLAAKKAGAPGMGTFPVAGPTFSSPANRHGGARGGAEFSPRPRPGTRGGTFPHGNGPPVLNCFPLGYASTNPSLLDRRILVPAFGGAIRKLDPRVMIRNPVMMVTLVGAVLTTLAAVTTPGDRGSSSSWPCGCGSPSCLPTSPRLWPKDG